MFRERLEVVVDCIKNDRLYTFNIPYGVPYTDVYEVIDELKKHISDMEVRNKEAQEKAAQQSAPIEAEVVSNG